ncbi:hypothetical protein, partial [Phaeodactylibacter xiamenensis]
MKFVPVPIYVLLLLGIALLSSCTEDDPPQLPEFPKTYSLSGYESADREYVLVTEQGYTPITPSDYFVNYVDTMRATDWLLFVGDNFFIQEIVLQNETEAQLTFMDDPTTGATMLADSLEYEVAGQEITFTRDGFVMVFDYNSGADRIEICEVTFHFVEEEGLNGTPSYFTAGGEF